MDILATQHHLEERGYIVSCFDTAVAATAYLDAQIDGQTVGFGGSVTLQQMGLYDRLAAHNDVSWHWRVPAGRSADEVLERARLADVYIASVNALAETGEIVQIDGNGNRVSAILYGHKKVYLVAGENKIRPDCARAIDRARHTAAPMNARRLHAATPCAERGDRCYDCQSPARICRSLSVLWGKPMVGEFEVVLIRESLGY